MITTTQQNMILKILSSFEPKGVGIFGSYARGENNEQSDLDILVEFGKRMTLLDLVALEQELSEALDLKVDLVTKNSLSPLIREFVEKDLKIIA